MTSLDLLRSRKFLPLFVTQLLNAFNDNLYKNAMVLFVVYSIYNSEAAEGAFSGVASGGVHPPLLPPFRARRAIGRHA